MNHTSRLIGAGNLVSNDTWQTRLNNNDVIIGPSGAGKTRGYVIPNLLRGNESMIVADTKGNLCRLAGPILKDKGYKVLTLDFVRPEASCAYNPLDYVRYNERTGRFREQDIVSITDCLVPPMPRDPYWSDAAKQVVASVIGFVLERLPEEERHMGSVAELMGIFTSSAFDRLFAELALLDEDSFALRQYRLYAPTKASEKTYACISQMVSNALAVFAGGEAVQIFNRPSDFDFRQLGREKTVLFVNISDTDRAFDKLLDVFYTQAFQTLCQEADSRADSRLAVPVRIILDDFATNAFIPHFDRIISVIRSREIYTSLILQSITQLETLYSHAEAVTILNNCDHMLYLGGQDIETARYVSQKADKSVSTILNMPVGEGYLFTRGQQPQRLRQIETADPFRVEELPQPEADCRPGEPGLVAGL